MNEGESDETGENTAHLRIEQHHALIGRERSVKGRRTGHNLRTLHADDFEVQVAQTLRKIVRGRDARGGHGEFGFLGMRAP